LLSATRKTEAKWRMNSVNKSLYTLPGVVVLNADYL